MSSDILFSLANSHNLPDTRHILEDTCLVDRQPEPPVHIGSKSSNTSKNWIHTHDFTNLAH